jgi:uncharacterized SAM-binding protein YcdF (DUF218 family)
MSFVREFDYRGKKILIVTSRYHARRARLIFRRLLPGADIRVVGPQDRDYRHWWRDRELADQGVLEVAKLVYFLVGGRFLSTPAAG